MLDILPILRSGVDYSTAADAATSPYVILFLPLPFETNQHELTIITAD